VKTGEKAVTLADDLRAAKALIDTVEKWAAMQMSHSAALFEACPSWERYVAADQALDAIRLRCGSTHACLMERLDRAIAAAEATP
jgi:hypothetical protein